MCADALIKWKWSINNMREPTSKQLYSGKGNLWLAYSSKYRVAPPPPREHPPTNWKSAKKRIDTLTIDTIWLWWRIGIYYKSLPLSNGRWGLNRNRRQGLILLGGNWNSQLFNSQLSKSFYALGLFPCLQASAYSSYQLEKIANLQICDLSKAHRFYTRATHKIQKVRQIWPHLVELWQRISSLLCSSPL